YIWFYFFSPNDVTIKLGDEIIVVSSGLHSHGGKHKLLESRMKYPKSGGFNFGVGTNSFTPTAVGIIYYVCSPCVRRHERKITVSTSTSIQTNCLKIQK
ncbi:MAG: hypothetical protein IPQ19_13520, partial [Bacteroidetes bacterium]|nr:hypothetical protein [Bacteroidota bacterium]